MADPILKGVRVALTRDERGNRPLAAKLAVLGARVELCPLIRITPAPDPQALADALARVADFDWVVITSANAAFAVLEHGPVPPRALACVGESTAEVFRTAGWNVDLVPQRRTAKGLLEALAETGVKGTRVLYPRSEIAPDTLAQGLTALGARVESPVAYGNCPDPDGVARLRTLLADGALDAVVFASASAVNNAAEVAREALSAVRLYSIGPSTTLALKAHGLVPVAEAVDHDLLEAILQREARRD